MSSCARCEASCCRYFALEIDTPRSKTDFENIRWYLAHKDVAVFVNKKKWHLEITSECRYLGKDNKCRIYSKRPLICKEHSVNNCEFHSNDFEHEHMFSSLEQLDEYINKRFKKRKCKRLESDSR
ncbi:MAG: YkgJ family cysteine cluster protein [Candidatus Omnitrophota bacterium]